ncbi:class I SAM-dependent methyltransferase [uncultured Desulfobacter sp.]|uniref:class I SAM-dependent methyltransferase n=1 Tax=uncultured Desulfobacter sp. TaxID=240139 RepID=UPI002AA5F5FC|nr:class I SAM-dependent methyltransferase [uncultured Desulfobacter sp.]
MYKQHMNISSSSLCVFPELSFPLLEAFPDIFQKPDWAMDLRHVMMLYNLLCAAPFRCVIEIGSHYGVSTSAFVQAQHRREFEFHICDVKVHSTVRNMNANGIAKGLTVVHEKTSWEFLSRAPKFDFVLLDGSHIAEHVQDEFELLSAIGLRTIALHDTRTQFLPESAATPWFDGPPRIAEKLSCSTDWLSVEDAQRRAGELTHRGFFLATRDIHVYRLARQSFEHWASVTTEEVHRLCGMNLITEPQKDPSNQ